MSYKQAFDLSGKKALITGSSDGIGKAIAMSLAEFGASVVIHGKDNSQECQDVVNEIEKRKGQATFCLGDICEEAGVRAIVQKVESVDILILNASVQIRKHFSNITEDEFNTQMYANVWSGLKMINHFHPAMKQNQWGRIVFIGSVQQVKPHPQMLIYAASKAAIANLTINLATQLAPEGITVNCMAPGVIETARNAEALSDAAYAKSVRSKIPVNYFGQPSDCASLTTLLCSDAGRYITGQNIFCDGGMSL